MTRWAFAGGLALSGVIATVAANALPLKASGAQPVKVAANTANSSVQKERYSDLWGGGGGGRYGDLTSLSPPPTPPSYVQAPPSIMSGGS